MIHPVVADITHGLKTAEESNDLTISSAAAMIQALVADREQLKIGYGVIQGPLADASKAIALTVEARAHLGRCHRRMYDLAIEHKVIGHGDIVPTFDDPTPTKAVAGLPIAA
ncbi:hypothetical protein [Sphingomonas sp. VNH70]|uniref:hypothetical protein n=1 Tax=Sphingomonas silueang TaxID=3156617 RepID=UPI0032B51E0F